MDATDPTAVRIRPAEPGDAPAIGALIADALPEKVTPAFGARGAEAIATLVDRDLDRPVVRYLVADEDGAVVASARLAVGQDTGDGIRPLADAIGWAAALRAALVLGLLTHRRLGPDEAYVEEFAVRLDRRRLGIGRALLAACEAAARSAGKRRTTLWVAAGNSAAVGLYRTSGYRVIRRRGTLRGRFVFGAPVALLMEKDLTAER